MNLSTFLANNSIHAGTNNFYLDAGQDTLVFNPAIYLGTNYVYNFGINQDLSRFNDLPFSLSDVEPNLDNLVSKVSSVGSDGQGGTVLTFHTVDAHGNGGTINFVNIAYAPASTAVTPTDIHSALLDLVNHHAAHILTFG